MKWIRLFEEFQLGDLNFMSPEEIQDLFFKECYKDIPDLELIRVILENGLVDIEANNKDGITLLHIASGNGHTDLAKLLIQMGADVGAKDKWDHTPLHRASWGGHTDLAKLLIEAGADVNDEAMLGYTPLHYAESEEMKALLKQYGAVE